MMMKGYHRHKSSQKTRRSLSIGIVVLLLLVLFYTALGSFLKKTTSPIFISVLSPVWSLQDSVQGSLKSLSNFTKDKNKLVEENRKLDIRLQAFEAIEASLRVLRSENKELKEMLGRIDIGERNIVVASILIRPNQSLYDTLIVDAGRDLGIKVGDRIIVEDTIVLGEVTEVFPRQSRVELFSSPGKVIEVAIGEENINTLAEGIGGNNFQAQLPREADINIGDSITIPSIDVFVLGVVGEIFSNPSDSFQTILFKTPVNIQQLRWVQIVI